MLFPGEPFARPSTSYPTQAMTSSANLPSYLFSGPDDTLQLSAEYVAAIAAHDESFLALREAREGHRVGHVSDGDFCLAYGARQEAHRLFDAAFYVEQERLAALREADMLADGIAASDAETLADWMNGATS